MFFFSLMTAVIPALLLAGNVKIQINGTLSEPVTLTVGDRTEVIYSLPYKLEIDKKKLPIVGKFSSPNHVYKDITFNKKEPDGRYYILHYDEDYEAARKLGMLNNNFAVNVNANSTSGQPDRSIEVNNAPDTKKKSKNTFALIIANEEYENVSHVDMALNDGMMFKEYCVRTLGIPETCVKYYQNATYGQFTKAIKNIQEIADAFDGDINLILYYAGHGIPDNATKDAYLMPIDADGTDTSICFSLTKLYNTIEDMKLNQAVVFLDACFSGAQRDGGMIVAARGVAVVPKASTPKGSTIVISATSGEEAAFSYKEKQHGMFSYFLLKSLQDSKGDISLGDLYEKVSKQVRQNSIVVNGTSQTPNIYVSSAIQDSWKNLKLTRK